MIGDSTAPIVLVIGKVLLSPSNRFSKLFNFSNCPNVNPAKLSLNVSRTVNWKVLNEFPAAASVGIPAAVPVSYTHLTLPTTPYV